MTGLDFFGFIVLFFIIFSEILFSAFRIRFLFAAFTYEEFLVFVKR